MKSPFLQFLPLLLFPILSTAQPSPVVRQRAAAIRASQPTETILDPVRVINGATATPNLSGNWYRLYGKVIGVHTGGIIVHGSYSNNSSPLFDDEKDFHVCRFPYQVAEGDTLGYGSELVALRVGTYNYITVLGATRTIHNFDYGQLPYAAPQPIRSQTATDKLRDQILADQRKSASDAAVLKFHLERAAAGNESSQLRLIELYTQRGDTNSAALWRARADTNSTAPSPSH